MHRSKAISLVLGLVVVALASFIAYSQPRTGAIRQNSPSAQPSTFPAEQKTYSLSDISSHKDASSCWTVVRETVYDLTTWIASHPGGEGAILNMCGRDATTDFMTQHGGQPQPEQALASFKIGMIK